MKMIMIPHPFDNDYDTIIQNARNVMSDEAFEAFKLGLSEGAFTFLRFCYLYRAGG